MILNRRSLLRGMASVLAAPAIVRVARLMPVRAFASVTEEIPALGTYARYSGYDALMINASDVYSIPALGWPETPRWASVRGFDAVPA